MPNYPGLSVTLTASQSTITYGDTVVLTWDITGATPDRVTLSSVPISNSHPLWYSNGDSRQRWWATKPEQSTCYTVTVTDVYGQTATSTVCVTVLGVTLNAIPTTVVSGSSTTLIWTSLGGTTLTIDNGVGVVSGPNGSTGVVVTNATTFTITSTATDGSTVTASVSVSVTGSIGSGGVYSGGTTGPTIQTEAFSLTVPPPSYFSGESTSWPAGTYYFEYVTGYYTYTIDPFYTAYNSQAIYAASVNTGSALGRVTDGAISGGFFTAAAAMAASAGQYTSYVHSSGNLGLRTQDSGYANNANGSPNTTFRLTGPAPIGSLSVSIVAGVTYLNWAAAGRTASINNGIGVLFSTTSNSSGSIVIPTITENTNYTLTITSDGFSNYVASLSIYAPISGSITRSPSIIYAGDSSTLTWASNNSTSRSIDQGIGAVSANGSMSVSPSVTTTYTLTLNGSFETSIIRSATVTVTALPPPTSVSATGRCGSIALAWAAAGPYTSFNILRGTSPGSETLLATTSGLTYTDTPPSTWTNYYYVIQAVNGTATSLSSAEVSAQSTATPVTAPTGLTAIGKTPVITISGTAVAHTTSYNLYRGNVTGHTTLYKTGLDSPSYIDYLTDLSPTNWVYRMSSVNTCGESALSSEVIVIPEQSNPWGGGNTVPTVWS